MIKKEKTLKERYPDETCIRIKNLDRDRIKKFAEDNGLKMPYAVQELIKRGLSKPSWI